MNKFFNQYRILERFPFHICDRQTGRQTAFVTDLPQQEVFENVVHIADACATDLVWPYHRLSVAMISFSESAQCTFCMGIVCNSHLCTPADDFDEQPDS